MFSSHKNSDVTTYPGLHEIHFGVFDVSSCVWQWITYSLETQNVVVSNKKDGSSHYRHSFGTD